MAKKPTPITENDDLSPIGNEADLDQAIDDLRGVLKADATGEAPAFDAEFGAGSSDFDLDAQFGERTYIAGGHAATQQRAAGKGKGQRRERRQAGHGMSS